MYNHLNILNGKGASSPSFSATIILNCPTYDVKVSLIKKAYSIKPTAKATIPIEIKFTISLNFGKYKIEKIFKNALALIALHNIKNKTKLTALPITK